MAAYRICSVSHLYYPGAHQRVGDVLRDLQDADFSEQKRMILALRLVRSDSFVRAMRTLGHEAEEVLSDVWPLHGAWLRQHGIADRFGLGDTRAAMASTLGQIAECRPDVVYIQGLSGFPEGFVPAIREYVPSVRLVAGYAGDRVRPSHIRDLDLLFACVPSLLAGARDAGMDAVTLYHGFDAECLKLLPDSPPPMPPFVFAGSTGFGFNGTHPTRYRGLIELMRKTPLELWATELGTTATDPDHQAFARTFHARGDDDDLADLFDDRLTPCPLSVLYPQRYHEPRWGLDMLDLLRGAGVVFNIHCEVPGKCVGNMRLFEATGVGACLLTDNGTNMDELFVPDREVVTYDTIDEAVEKARYLLEHDDERRRIAAAGQQATLTRHQTIDRARLVDDHIQRLL